MKGMQKIKRGTGFRGACEYALEDGRGQIIGGNMTGTTPRELAAEFGQSRKIREDIEKPVWHNSLRLPKGERVPAEKWEKIADDYMEKMGFGDLHQRVYVMHDDTDGQHVHIIASRIDLTGQMYLGQNENLKSTQHIAQLERDHGLIITQLEPDPDKVRQRPPTPGEKGLAERTGEVPARLQLQAIIDEASADRPDLAEFAARLDAAGVSILPSGKTGAPQGVSFEINGQPFKGSDLGKSYAWKQLQARIDYDRDRDQHIIDDLRARTTEDAEIEQGQLSTPLPYFAPEPRKGQPRTLELALDKEGDSYKWKGRDRVALIDKGDSIAVLSRADSAIRASLQLSKDKGWQSVTATGSEEFRRKSWLIGSEMGIKVEGYEPSQSDRDELKNILARKEAARNERKNSGTQEQGDGPGAGKNDGIRVGRPDATDGDRPQPYSGESRASDRGSQGSESATGQQPSDFGDIQATGADHTRGPDMADAGRVSRDRPGIRSVRAAAQSVSDIAAPIINGSADRAERRDIAGGHQGQLQPDHAAKIAAWERQSEALGAEKYRITLKPRAEKDRSGRKLFDQNYGNEGRKREREAAGVVEKFWTADEVKAEIFKLRAKNAQGYDVYITPIDDSKHFIVVDDMTPDKEKALIDAGVKPAIIQKSSDSNKQAIIVIDREPGKDEQKLANQLVVRLNKKFGDEKFSGVIHPFRMAGFSNKKDGKKNYLTTVEISIRRKCNKVSVEMKKIRYADRQKNQHDDRLKKEMSIKEETDKERSRRLSKIDTDGQINGNTVEQAYRREVRKTVGLAKKKGWELDWSRVDFAATKELLKAGYRADLVEKAIIEASPELADRHRDAARYAADTVNNARADAEVIKALNERAQRVDRGPSLDR